MAGFLYFKPNHTSGIARADLVAWGLGYAFSGPVSKGLCMGGTPQGASGAIFADPRRQGERPVKMDLAAQQWEQLPGSDVWVGMWRDARPTPAELARPPLMDGYDVRLADGVEWRIPLVRRFDRAQLTTVSNLPCYMQVDAEGNWHRGPVLELHAHLWDVTAPVADALLAEYTEGQSPELTDGQIFACACALLAANYCVGPGELSLMRALTSEASVHAACMAACDWPQFMEWAESQKKSTCPPVAAGSITFAGGIT